MYFAISGSSLEGSRIEVVLAKPVDKEHVRYTRGAGRGGIPLMPGLAGYAGLDLTGAGSALTAAYMGLAGPAGAPLSPLSPAAQFSPRGGMTAVSRGPVRGRGRGAAGIRGTGGRTYLAAGHQYRKHPAELLEEFCNKNGWGTPTYSLMSTTGRDNTGAEVQLFLFKVGRIRIFN